MPANEDPYGGVDPKIAYKTGYLSGPEKDTHSNDPYRGVDPSKAFDTGYSEYPEHDQPKLTDAQKIDMWGPNRGPSVDIDEIKNKNAGTTAEDQYSSLRDKVMTLYGTNAVEPVDMPGEWNVELGQRLPDVAQFTVRIREDIITVVAKFKPHRVSITGRVTGDWELAYSPVNRESIFPTFKEFIQL